MKYTTMADYIKVLFVLFIISLLCVIVQTETAEGDISITTPLSMDTTEGNVSVASRVEMDTQGKNLPLTTPLQEDTKGENLLLTTDSQMDRKSENLSLTTSSHMDIKGEFLTLATPSNMDINSTDLPSTTPLQDDRLDKNSTSSHMRDDDVQPTQCLEPTKSRLLARLRTIHLRLVKCLSFYVDSTVQELDIWVSGGTLKLRDFSETELERFETRDSAPDGHNKHVFRPKTGIHFIKILPIIAESTAESKTDGIDEDTESGDNHCPVIDFTAPTALTQFHDVTDKEEEEEESLIEEPPTTTTKVLTWDGDGVLIEGGTDGVNSSAAGAAVVGATAVTADSDDEPVEVQVMGLSSLDFLVMFANPVTMETLKLPPIAGDNTIVKAAIMCTNENHANLTYLIVYDSSGEIINRTAAPDDEMRNGFTYFLLEAPRETFYLGLEGYDVEGNIFRRVSTDLVEPTTVALSFATPAFADDLSPNQTLNFQIRLRNKGQTDVFEIKASFDLYMDYLTATVFPVNITVEAEDIETVDISVSVHDSITQQIGSNLAIEVKRKSDNTTTTIHRWVIARPTSFGEDTEPPECDVVFETDQCQPEFTPDDQYWSIMAKVTDQSGVFKASFLDPNISPQSFIKQRTVLGRLVADVFSLHRCDSQNFSVYVEDFIGNHRTCMMKITTDEVYQGMRDQVTPLDQSAIYEGESSANSDKVMGDTEIGSPGQLPPRVDGETYDPDGRKYDEDFAPTSVYTQRRRGPETTPAPASSSGSSVAHDGLEHNSTDTSTERTQPTLLVEEGPGTIHGPGAGGVTIRGTTTKVVNHGKVGGGFIENVMGGSIHFALVVVFSLATAVTCGFTIRSYARTNSKTLRGSYKPAYDFKRSKRVRISGGKNRNTDADGKCDEYFKMTVYKSNMEEVEGQENLIATKERVDSGGGESFASTDGTDPSTVSSSRDEAYSSMQSSLRKRQTAAQGSFSNNEEDNNDSNQATGLSGTPSEYNMVKWLAEVNSSMFEPQNKSEIYQSIEQFRETLEHLEERRNKLVGAVHGSENDGIARVEGLGNNCTCEDRNNGDTSNNSRDIERAEVSSDVAKEEKQAVAGLSHPTESPSRISNAQQSRVASGQQSPQEISGGAKPKDTGGATSKNTTKRRTKEATGNDVKGSSASHNSSSSRSQAKLQQGHVGMLIEGATQISLRHQIERLKERLLQCSKDVEDALRRERSMYDNLSDLGIDEDIDTDTDSDLEGDLH